jgi:hypothetical protein
VTLRGFLLRRLAREAGSSNSELELRLGLRYKHLCWSVGGESTAIRIIWQSGTSVQGALLGKPHFSQGKRMREIAKKRKQEDKRERKKARQNPQGDETPGVPAAEA